MKISVLTLFPGMFSALGESMIGRAMAKGLINCDVINIRDFAQNKHSQADDYPFGGGAGMVMMPQPVFDAFASIDATEPPHRIYLSPRGNVLTAARAQELALLPHIALLCGHYEGVDQRICDTLIDEEISVGDYVVTGGELPAMLLIDAVARFIPGVLGSEVSAEDESHADGLLEYPQYTRPADFRGLTVPEVLLSGHHANIMRWRRQQQLLVTAQMRPDLLTRAELTPEDKVFLSDNGIMI